ncbi:predicted protein [Sclerotinia sclerotiorum 1980 UF-70]|uniref:Uncharacterized protein n=1 Tax=Sclerotinia sclerotiorum (strain ATCC 18683 / 1980 / Ss-1) TaxID=665079 RepID=A7E665_SCLS1|nr:predicted protein [Sclerotinia sclerotiorum 1980 UF-70]EDN91387.1 predicted protein [Sclerotinia sclerotiorum 1980 UF-70]
MFGSIVMIVGSFIRGFSANGLAIQTSLWGFRKELSLVR